MQLSKSIQNKNFDKEFEACEQSEMRFDDSDELLLHIIARVEYYRISGTVGEVHRFHMQRCSLLSKDDDHSRNINKARKLAHYKTEGALKFKKHHFFK